MKIRKKATINFEYEEVLDARTRELIRVGCAVAVGCSECMRHHFALAKEAGAGSTELREAIAYGIITPGGRAKNFANEMLAELEVA
jgi:AhpD family alkylhydroperoxidase